VIGASDPSKAFTDARPPAGLGGRLDEPVPIAERVILRGNSLELFDRFSDGHAFAVALRPAEHPWKRIALLTMLLRPPQCAFVARQDDVTLFAGVGEDLVVVRALSQFGLEVNDPHDSPAALAQRLCEGARDVFVKEQRKTAGHAAAQRSGANLSLFPLCLASELCVFGKRCIDLVLVIVVIGKSCV
jgi:hypothetical protein